MHTLTDIVLFSLLISHEVDGECVVGPSQRARKSKRIAAQ